VHGQRERLHPPVAAAIDQHQFLAARVKRLDPKIPAQDNALRVPRPVERDTGHHGAVGIADFQIQHIAPTVKRQGRSRVGRQAGGGEGGYPKELACEEQSGFLPGVFRNNVCQRPEFIRRRRLLATTNGYASLLRVLYANGLVRCTQPLTAS